jgi:hypothetical protein
LVEEIVEVEEAQDMDEAKFRPSKEHVYNDPSNFLHVQEILEPHEHVREFVVKLMLFRLLPIEHVSSKSTYVYVELSIVKTHFESLKYISVFFDQVAQCAQISP